MNITPTFLRCAVVALALFSVEAAAMTLNVTGAWANKCSSPAKPELAFYSHQSETLLFEAGDNVTIYCQSGVKALGLTWSLHRNMVKTPFLTGTAEALPSNRFKIPVDAAKLPPGFYDLRVQLDVGLPKTLDGVCVFGWEAGKIPLRETRPADFRAFWDKALAEYAKVPLDAKIESEVKVFKGKEIDEYLTLSACLPPTPYDPQGIKTDEVESFKISFAGPDGGRVYAWLAKPKGDGPFPAMLVLPGAGFNARTRPLEHARHGFLAIDIQVHGQDVDLPKYEHPPGYDDDSVVYEPAEKNPMMNLYLRALRAVDYLCSRSDVDQKRIVTVGGSQGGRLSLVVPALDKRVVATVPSISWGANYPYLAWSAKCNGVNKPEDKSWRPGYVFGPKSDGMALTDAPPQPDTPAAKCAAYYDPMNFAPDVKCPVFMNAGLIDYVSPPSNIWASYLRLGSTDKTLIPLPGLGHDWSAEFDRRAWRWLDSKLGDEKAGAKN